MPKEMLLDVGSRNSLIVPEGVMRPILPDSVNQRLPSGPVVMPRMTMRLPGCLVGGSGESLMVAEGGTLSGLLVTLLPVELLTVAARRGGCRGWAVCFC